MPLSLSQLKRKLREIKQLETTVRFRHLPDSERGRLVWDAYFSTRSPHDPSVKFSLALLQKKNHDELKAIFEEYFYQIYFQYVRERGLSLADVYDPGLLALLGLSPSVGLQEIKQRYRQLARQYHPDHGGDSEKFIQLVDLYEKVTGQA